MSFYKGKNVNIPATMENFIVAIILQNKSCTKYYKYCRKYQKFIKLGTAHNRNKNSNW